MKIEEKLWLASADMTGDITVELCDAGEERLFTAADGAAKKLLGMRVKLPSGEPRVWTLNKTSQRTLARRFGVDTVNWVGQKVVLYKVQQMVGKDLKDVFYVR